MILDDIEDYADDYPTCTDTHATFRVYHASADPDLISTTLGLVPDESSAAHTDDRGRKRLTVWLLSSEGRVKSRDVRRHIDWLTGQLEGRADAFSGLREQGFALDVFCYWYGVGHGGPMLSPRQMSSLAALGLTIGFDIYT